MTNTTYGIKANLYIATTIRSYTLILTPVKEGMKHIKYYEMCDQIRQTTKVSISNIEFSSKVEKRANMEKKS